MSQSPRRRIQAAAVASIAAAATLAGAGTAAADELCKLCTGPGGGVIPGSAIEANDNLVTEGGAAFIKIAAPVPDPALEANDRLSRGEDDGGAFIKIAIGGIQAPG